MFEEKKEIKFKTEAVYTLKVIIYTRSFDVEDEVKVIEVVNTFP